MARTPTIFPRRRRISLEPAAPAANPDAAPAPAPPGPTARAVPRGRITIVNGLPCLTAGLVALDWVNLSRKCGSGYAPLKGEPVFLHVVLRRQDSRTKTWAMWDGGTVLTRMPADTDHETLRHAALHMMKHLYWPVRDFKGWSPVLAKLAAITPNHFPEPSSGTSGHA